MAAMHEGEIKKTGIARDERERERKRGNEKQTEGLGSLLKYTVGVFVNGKFLTLMSNWIGSGCKTIDIEWSLLQRQISSFSAK